MTTRRHRIISIALAVAAPFALSACGTSFGAQTNQQYQAGVGANLRTGELQAFNALFVDNGDGTATFSGALLAFDEDQTISSVAVDETEAELAEPIELTVNELATLGGEAEIVLRNDEVTAGDYVTITFTATPAGAVSLKVPVVARTETYDSVAEAPKPTATPSTEATEAAGS